MKTDRRHELQTNVLADWIGKHLTQWQGHSKTILAVLLLVVAAAIAGTFLVQDQAARSQAGWNKFFLAFGERDPKALGQVAAANQGTTAAVWAHLAEADLKLEEGIGDLYTNRDNAKENLAEAERSYLAVDGAATETILRERAWFGLGQVYESMADIDKAKQFYGKLVTSSPNSGLGKEAERRVRALNDKATEKWYNWFANQTPRPPSIPGMADDLGLPDLPGDLGNLSDRPDLSLPGLPPVEGPDAGTSPLATEPPEAGPELNEPATEADAPESGSPEPQSEEGATTPEEKAEQDTSKTPAEPAPAKSNPEEPTPTESEPESSETPSGDDSSE